MTAVEKQLDEQKRKEERLMSTQQAVAASPPSVSKTTASSSEVEANTASAAAGCEASTCSHTTTTDDLQPQQEDEEEEDDHIGFMFEANQPSKTERFQWTITRRDEIASSMLVSKDDETSQNNNKRSTKSSSTIRVVLNVADDEPGAVQSGHYLWPAAQLLADYLVKHHHYESSTTAAPVVSVVELGAGCALASLTALQLWQPTLQCVLVTDHDPGTLDRARDNHESTIEALMDACETEEQVEWTINQVASIPVLFESLEWGPLNAPATTKLRDECLEDHTTSPRHHFFDRVLGSDLIYCKEVVKPLLETARTVMNPETGRFILSQSFVYEDSTEAEIDLVCQQLGLTRRIVEFTNEHDNSSNSTHQEEGDSSGEGDFRRIQEFYVALKTTASQTSEKEDENTTTTTAT